VRVHELDHIVLNTPDVERSLAFYTGLLGMKGDRVDEWRAGQVPFPSVRVNGETIIDIMRVDRTGENMNHLCLVVDADDVDAVAVDPRFDIVSPPVMRYGARGEGRSVYVRDPDGNVVELRSY
jgi:catechol 2,3-dioxygenase-like lactoylglutathione lyase family enzyme